MPIVDILGRIFLSAIFLIEGVSKIFNYEGTTAYMENYGVPTFLYVPAIIIEIQHLLTKRTTTRNLHLILPIKYLECIQQEYQTIMGMALKFMVL